MGSSGWQTFCTDCKFAEGSLTMQRLDMIFGGHATPGPGGRALSYEDFLMALAQVCPIHLPILSGVPQKTFLAIFAHDLRGGALVAQTQSHTHTHSLSLSSLFSLSLSLSPSLSLSLYPSLPLCPQYFTLAPYSSPSHPSCGILMSTAKMRRARHHHTKAGAMTYAVPA
jgi:hypothetical protein